MDFQFTMLTTSFKKLTNHSVMKLILLICLSVKNYNICLRGKISSSHNAKLSDMGLPRRESDFLFSESKKACQHNTSRLSTFYLIIWSFFLQIPFRVLPCLSTHLQLKAKRTFLAILYTYFQILICLKYFASASSSY